MTSQSLRTAVLSISVAALTLASAPLANAAPSPAPVGRAIYTRVSGTIKAGDHTYDIEPIRLNSYISNGGGPRAVKLGGEYRGQQSTLTTPNGTWTLKPSWLSANSYENPHHVWGVITASHDGSPSKVNVDLHWS